MNRFVRAIVAVSFVGFCQYSLATVVHVFDGDKLTGATGVVVGDKIYDVTFGDGSCNSLFSNCSSAQFAFSTYGGAEAAALALLSQVFVDIPNHLLDSSSSLTRGCEDANVCGVWVPYSTFAFQDQAVAAVNRSAGFPYPDSVMSISGGFATDLQSYANHTYAVFAYESDVAVVPAQIPEPTTLLLAAIALSGLAAVRHRQSERNIQQD